MTARAALLLIALVAVLGAASARAGAAALPLTPRQSAPAAYGADDGPPGAARFGELSAIAVDTNGTVYVTQSCPSALRAISPAGVTRIIIAREEILHATAEGGCVDGDGGSPLLSNPRGVAADAASNIYVADTGHDRIVKVALDGAATVLAGSGLLGHADGPGTSATFDFPAGIAVAADGSVYVAESDRIRRIAPDGVVSTFAGATSAGRDEGFADGPAAQARFRLAWGLALDGAGNPYVADRANNRIRKVAPDGSVSTLAGSGIQGYSDGLAAAAQFDAPASIAADAAGTLYVTESDCPVCGRRRIRAIAADGSVSTYAGTGEPGLVDGQAASAAFRSPLGVAADAAGNVFVADAGNNRVRRISPAGEVGHFAGAFDVER